MVIEKYRETWPPAIAGTAVDKLSGGAIHWRTIQNKRARREIPSECFAYSGRKVLIIRDPFLAWWSTTLREA
jgi:hypothetical protein